MKNYFLGREEAYNASPQVWSFRSMDDIVNGINLRFKHGRGIPLSAEAHFGRAASVYTCAANGQTTPTNIVLSKTPYVNDTSGFGAKRFGKLISKFHGTISSISDCNGCYLCVAEVQGQCRLPSLATPNTPGRSILVENTTTDKWRSAEIWGCKIEELGTRD